jgi:hypothetical protein
MQVTIVRGHSTGGGRSADYGTHQRALGLRELQRGIAIQPQTGELGTLLQGLLDQPGRVGLGSAGHHGFGQIESLRLRQPERV